jgi:hypothetical protein
MSASTLRPTIIAAIKDAETLHKRLTDILADLDGTDVIQVPRQGRWTKSEFEALWERVNHLPGVRALFEITAEHPNDAVTFSAVVERSGLEDTQQRNEHARLSTVTTQLFDKKRWPIEYWQGSPDADTGKAQMLYRMGGTVAGWWREIAN